MFALIAMFVIIVAIELRNYFINFLTHTIIISYFLYKIH